MHAATHVFEAIASQPRRVILERLASGPMPVAEIAEDFKMSLPAVSQHLKVLREAGLVTVAKRGKQRIYNINPQPLQEVSEWVTQYESYWKDKLATLGKHLEKKK